MCQKRNIWINGQPVEVSDAVFAAYQKGERKMRYFEYDLKVDRAASGDENRTQRDLSREVSLEGLSAAGEQFAPDIPGVEEAVLQRFQVEALKAALQTLSEEERRIINALFYEELSERDAAGQLGITQPALHKRKVKILKKLKEFLEE